MLPACIILGSQNLLMVGGMGKGKAGSLVLGEYYPKLAGYWQVTW